MQKLELTWIGKGDEPVVEPRILLHDASKDYGNPAADNMLIHGDNLLALKAERTVLARQRELVTQELNTTSQRVNLFEKVKIPECRENIRIIKIAIGDEQTASVTRGKIAKGRSKPASEEEDAA